VCVCVCVCVCDEKVVEREGMCVSEWMCGLFFRASHIIFSLHTNNLSLHTRSPLEGAYIHTYTKCTHTHTLSGSYLRVLLRGTEGHHRHIFILFALVNAHASLIFGFAGLHHLVRPTGAHGGVLVIEVCLCVCIYLCSD
jgi:hypothetical protein